MFLHQANFQRLWGDNTVAKRIQTWNPIFPSPSNVGLIVGPTDNPEEGSEHIKYII